MKRSHWVSSAKSLGIAITVLAGGACGLWADDPASDGTPASQVAAAKSTAEFPAASAPTAKKRRPTAPDQRVRLNFNAAPWSKVLRRVAKHAGLELVMKSCPPGRLTRSDMTEYNIPEALRILNRELEPVGFRLMRDKEFLLVLDLDEVRSSYNKPSIVRTRQEGEAGTTVNGATDAPVPGNQAEEEPDDPPRVRMYYSSTPWSAVLQDLATDSGLTVVAKRCPSGSVHRIDFKRHTVSEAVLILNEELVSTGFRIVREGKFLIVLEREDVRSEYSRALLGRRREAPPEQQIAGTPVPQPAPRESAVQPASATMPASATTESGWPFGPSNGEPSRIEPAVDERPVREAAAHQWQAPQDETPEPSSLFDAPAVYSPHHGRAESIAKQLYVALQARAEAIDKGPEGLPSFRVFKAIDEKGLQRSESGASGGHGSILMTVGVDQGANRIVIEAPPKRRAAAMRIFEELDAEQAADGGLQLISADAKTRLIAQNLAPELNFLVAQQQSQPQPQIPPVPTPPSPGPSSVTVPVPPTEGKPVSEIIKGLKGEVTVESVPELGILVLRGGTADVNAVMKIIREIERVGAAAAPQINVLELRYVNSEQFATLMDSIYKELHSVRTGEAQPRQAIRFFPIGKPNAVIIIAPPADMPSVLRLAHDLDRPVTPNTEFQVIPLRRAIATQVATAITNFYKERKGLGTKVMVVPDLRTNSVIVQARPSDLAEVRALVEQLDGPTASQATLKVFTLVNGDATTISRLLEALFVSPTGAAGQRQGAAGAGAAGAGGPFGVPGQATTTTTENAPTSLRLSVDVRTNSIIALGAPDTLRAVEAIILRLDTGSAHERKTEVFKLKNNLSDSVQRAIDQFARTQVQESATLEPEAVSTAELLEKAVYIVSEPLSNSILLSATPRYFSQLKAMIEKLDAAPPQVIIQALLVQVTLTNDDEFGIELGFQSPVLFDRSVLNNVVPFTTTTNLNPTTTVQNQILLSEQAVPGFQFGDTSQPPPQNPLINAGTVGTQEITNFGVGRTSTVNPNYGSGLVLSASSESVSFLLRALSYKENLTILSRPQIRTVDNQPATIQVGKRYPIISNFITNVTGSISPIVTQDPAGIILTVQPRITPEGLIVMHAYAENSSYESQGVPLITDPTTGRVISSPIKDITRAETTVSLASGETVVMGGMIQTNDDQVTKKVPWAGDLPVIGQLFRYDTKTTIRTELIIFLTPRLIRSDADDEMIKQVETERLHFIMEEAESLHGPILSNPSGLGPDGCPVPPLPPIVPSPTNPSPATPAPIPLIGPAQPFGGPPPPPEGPTVPPSPSGELRLQPSSPSDAKPPGQSGATNDASGTVRFSSFNEDNESSSLEEPSGGSK